jgi:hypothetical protein
MLRQGRNTPGAIFDGAMGTPARPTRTVSYPADPRTHLLGRLLHAPIDPRERLASHGNGPRLTTGLMPDERMHQLRVNGQRASRHQGYEIHRGHFFCQNEPTRRRIARRHLAREIQETAAMQPKVCVSGATRVTRC